MDRDTINESAEAEKAEAVASLPIATLEADRALHIDNSAHSGNPQNNKDQGIMNTTHPLAEDSNQPSDSPPSRPIPTTAGGTLSSLQQQEQGSSTAPSGAEFFSVPSSQTPSSGLYTMPAEKFQMKDLDSGRVFFLDKQSWIKDVDTGKVYVVESDAAEASGIRGSPDEAGRVRVSDLLSGQELSLEEFESAMGYFREPPPLQPPSPPPEQQHSTQSTADMVAAAQQLAQRSMHSLTIAAQVSATWIKGKASAAIGRTGGSPSNSYSSRFGSQTLGGSGPSIRFGGGGGGSDTSPGASSTTAIPTDGQGLPVKVSVTRKQFKELTDLRLVQQVFAHQGVVWTMRFSRSGRYLASAGQDGVVAVWEVLHNRADAAAAIAAAAGTGKESQPASPIHQGGGGGGGIERPSPPGGVGAAYNNNINEPASGGGGSSSAGPSSPIGSVDGTAGGGTGSTNDTAIFGVPVLRSKPYRLYHGHKQDILDVAWSKTNFLLSASMDKTVRLWHVSMDDCLRVFKHSDFVTAIDFHPSDDKLFVSGSIDGKVRLWNVPEQRVVSWQDVHDMVTAVGYSKDGKRAVVGTMRGKCKFYGAGGASGLEYEAQLDVKNKRGQHSRGKKVTGLTFAPGSSGTTDPSGSPALLITSNDSRIRLYDGYTLRTKYKGHQNKSTQIRASFSPKGDYIICGSDDGAVYIWSTAKTYIPGSPERTAPSMTGGIRAGISGRGGVGVGGGLGVGGEAGAPPTAGQRSSATTAAATAEENAPPEDPAAPKEKNAAYESFQAAGDVVTVALFAPESTHRSQESLSPTAAGGGSSGSGGVGSGGSSGKEGNTAFSPGSSGRPTASSNLSAVTSAGSARGQVIVTAGYSGEIKIYENVGLPQWL